MTAVILQARLDSNRLPGKALLPLGGRPLLFRVMEALKRLPVGLHLLACAEDCAVPFAPLAEEAGFVLAPGPKDDVLRRYAQAVKKFHVDRLIRATGDNPFVFIDAAAALHEDARKLGADYAGYSGLPYGAGVEAVDAEALLRADAEAVLDSEREHVCPYLYNHPETFLLHRPLVPEPWRAPSIRLTVDVEADYRRAERLYEALSQNEPAGYESAGWSGETIIRYARVSNGRSEAAP
ncbi:MAG: NTP transferase domain-containing protein [Treponema sp.]|jgi:spore coat polysaccharide biosynthesis protein SpsF|nr:NTP transferase domain-containing protein [Treponema sp.]